MTAGTTKDFGILARFVETMVELEREFAPRSGTERSIPAPRPVESPKPAPVSDAGRYSYVTPPSERRRRH